MTDKEKLIELIYKTGMVENHTRCKIIADELVANGVTIVENHEGETVWGIWDVTNYRTRSGKKKSKNVHVCSLRHLDYVRKHGKAEVRSKVCTKSDMAFMGKTVFRTMEEAEEAVMNCRKEQK